MSFVRLNPGVYLETIKTTYNRAIASKTGEDFAVDISSLKAAYDQVTISGSIEINALGYKSLSFITSWIEGSYAYFTFRNEANSSITMNFIRVTFICYGKK